ncbi:hypothetical protein K505DRAFT_363234 [Melanomma pulvis-pyrius CBS 109.77]|uniref:DUF7708 domain-containing protein n=1 Tax=Melanomma pulvis-pyrius CBS 109.77 TaxID=1314802 RepID=A0A6A6X841_9PLEO|nr:hypothetical protein K505DRAFT_363234 [Melanomma pulvis-pyrius CBS 109.77]
MTEDLPRFRRLWNLFPLNPDLERTLLAVYADIIDFYVNIIQHLGASPIKAHLKATFTNRETQFASLAKEVRKKTKRVSEEVRVANYEMERQRYETLTRLLKYRAKPFKEPVRLPCHHIPFPRNSRFVGRQSELESIRNCLSPILQTGFGPRSFVLHGLGGTGKSEVALQFAWQNTQSFPAILWVTADNPEKTFLSFVAIGVVAGFDRANLSGNEMGCRQTILNSLKNTTFSWLLIFDNAPEDDCDFLQGFWPSGEQGSVLVTTRNASFARRFNISNSYALEPVDVSTGCDIITSTLRLSDTDAANQKETVEEICEALGRLPLALSRLQDLFLRVDPRSQTSGKCIKNNRISARSTHLQRPEVQWPTTRRSPLFGPCPSVGYNTPRILSDC